jgi:hypothetical protein
MEAHMAAAESGAGARKKHKPYRCFLLRCRMEEAGSLCGEPDWRFTVQQVGPDVARRSFTGLSDVVTYIEAELASCSLDDKE